jgi:predicted esterase
MRSLLSLLLLATVNYGQVYTSGPQVLTFFSAVDDTDQPYGLYLPKNFDVGKAYPLVISLHGAGSNHRLNLRRVFGQSNRLGETDAEATRFFPKFKDVEFIVASPLARGTMGYQGIAEKDVYDVLADVQRRFRIDSDRIYLTGLSMGGGGTLWLGLTRPDLWAAIAPVCPYPPADAERLAANALNIPVKLYQGAIDPIVKAEDTRKWQKSFDKAGVKSEYVEYPGVRHNSWENAYENASIFDWFSQHVRVRFPERVLYTSASYSYAGAYWVQFDVLSAGAPASIDARFTGKNKLSIQTQNLPAFTLLLKDHPSFARAGRVNILIDGKTLSAKAEETLSLTKGEKGWVWKKTTPAANQKRKGLQGPIGDAVSSRHIYVYGTADSPAPEELQQRRAVAERAAEWSTPRSKLLLTLRVVADRDLKEEERASANLFLLGTRATNSVIAHLDGKLPMALQPSAADYGLLYVYPDENRYVVINSGLPWWLREDQANRPSMILAPPALRTLMTFGDFVLFKGGLDNIVAEGSFNENWKMIEADATKVRGAGVVDLRP